MDQGINSTDSESSSSSDIPRKMPKMKSSIDGKSDPKVLPKIGSKQFDDMNLNERRKLLLREQKLIDLQQKKKKESAKKKDEEELQKKPKTGPVSLFDTTEIDNPLSSDEHGDTDKKGNDNETDIRLQDPNENEDLHLNNDNRDNIKLT